MYRVRFNLGRGSNYLKWKILNTKTKEVQYLDPSKTKMILYNAKLCNNKTAAERIYKGHSKYVCAWIECEDIDFNGKFVTYESDGLFYDPKYRPYWSDNSSNDIDNKVYDKIYLTYRSVYAGYSVDFTQLKDFNVFVDYLKECNVGNFQSKSMSEILKDEIGVPKSSILKHISKLKELGVIERKHESGNCSSLCSSCYEYGCDAGPQPPINYWQINKNKLTNITDEISLERT